MNFASKSLLVSMSQLGAIVLGVLGSVVLCRAMGPDGTGQFNLFRQTATFAAALAAFGVGNACIYSLRNQKTAIDQVVGTLCGYAILVGLPLALLVSTVMLIFPEYFGVVSPWVLGVYAIGTASLMWLSLLRMVLVAQMAASRLAATSLTPVVILLVAGGVLALARRLTSEMAIALYAVSQMLALVQVLNYLHPHLRLHGSFSWSLLRRLFGYGSRLYVANLLNLVGSTGTMLLLRHYSLSDFSQVGLFSVAAGISAYINMPVQMVSPLLYAKWSEVSGECRLLQVEQVARVNMAFGVLVSIVAILLGRVAIWAMYGAQFVPAQAALGFMAVAAALMSFYAVFDNLLAGAGRAGVSVWIFCVTVPLSLGLTALFVPHMGFAGAAIATLVGNATTAIAGVLVCRRLIGIRPLNCLFIRISDVGYLVNALRRRESTSQTRSVG